MEGCSSLRGTGGSCVGGQEDMALAEGLLQGGVLGEQARLWRSAKSTWADVSTLLVGAEDQTGICKYSEGHIVVPVGCFQLYLTKLNKSRLDSYSNRLTCVWEKSAGGAAFSQGPIQSSKATARTSHLCLSTLLPKKSSP